MEILLLAVIAVLAVLGSGQFGLFDRILSPGPISPVEFAELALPKSPNAYLVGPKGYTTALPHADAPEFAISVNELKSRVNAIAHGERRVTKVWESEDGLELQYIQRSFLMRYPDIVSVKLIPLGEARSTLIIYSRSVYGYSDLGVNKARVNRWLAELQN
ncbi:MAG: DUF1499 domain-containing protein [Rhodobacteraceae bacterium]|nr:DUF1499 domain-containing protein [Paracoccaceae bacterium]